MGPFTVSRGSDRRLEGERNGSRSRRPDCDRCRRSPSNGVECGDRPSGAHGRQGARRADHRLQICSGTQIAARGRRKAAQGTPRGSQEAPQGASRQARPGLPGPEDNRPPGCREAPAYPSHPRAAPRGGAGRTARARRGQTPRATLQIAVCMCARGLTPFGGKVPDGPRSAAFGLGLGFRECRRMAGASRGQLRASWRCRSGSGASRRRAAVRQSRSRQKSPQWQAVMACLMTHRPTLAAGTNQHVAQLPVPATIPASAPAAAGQRRCRPLGSRALWRDSPMPRSTSLAACASLAAMLALAAATPVRAQAVASETPPQAPPAVTAPPPGQAPEGPAAAAPPVVEVDPILAQVRQQLTAPLRGAAAADRAAVVAFYGERNAPCVGDGGGLHGAGAPCSGRDRQGRRLGPRGQGVRAAGAGVGRPDRRRRSPTRRSSSASRS